MEDKYIVFVESSCVGACYLAEAAKRIGCLPLFLTNPSFSQGDTRECILRNDYLECDTNSVLAMKEALLGRLSISQIVYLTTFSDTCLMNAVNLAQELGIHGLPSVIGRLKDKGFVYDLVPEFSPPSVVFTADQIPLIAIQDLITQYKRVMVKGRKSSGGLGAIELNELKDTLALSESINNSGIPGHLGPEQWLAQAFITGQLVSLEGFVHKGQARFLGFSGRKKIGMSESMIMFPWDEHIHTDAQNQAKKAVSTLVERSGFDNAYFHVEFLIENQNAYIIDANMGRIGGGGLGQQLAISHQCMPDDVHLHALSLAINPHSTDNAIYTHRTQMTNSIMYGIPVAAKVSNVKVPGDFRGFHTRILDYCQVVPPMGQDNYSWIGITSGIRSDIEGETRRIIIETDRGEFHAVF